MSVSPVNPGPDPDFVLLSPIPAPCTDVRFRGSYSDPDIRWLARIMTLEYYRENYPGAAERSPAQFIEILASGGEECPVTIALDVPVINASVIHKTIIMVRQYRNLQVGRHEWNRI